ncbi:hypothetical protein [Microbulbifer sp. VVAC002]|uniref:hypothetical protein n=1 Tax=Microbulbifer sp. VVAC002 TaxID=3243387 RepID=UPI004039C2A9
MLKLFLKILPQRITISVVVALVIVILKVIWWNNVSEFFSFGHELGVVFEPLLVSFIASYIFYLFVVHYREVKEQYDFYPYALRFSKIITNTCKVELSHFSSASGVELKFESLKTEDLKRAFGKIDPNQKNAPIHFPVPNGFEAGNWIDYLKSNCEKIIHNVSKIVDSRAHIDLEWLKLLVEIEESAFVGFVRRLYKSNLPGHMPGSPFQDEGDMYFDYYQKCLALSKYIEKIELSLTSRSVPSSSR